MNERNPCTPISLAAVFPVSGGRHCEWPNLTLVGLVPEQSGVLLQWIGGPASCCSLELPLGPHLTGN